jgi:sarcosine oxidase subunit delta
MILIDCPNCGPRNGQEFRFGGEYRPRPAAPLEVEGAAWTAYVYMRANRLDLQTEWWYHRPGCGLWFLAERHTLTNQVTRTYRWAPTGEGDRP